MKTQKVNMKKLVDRKKLDADTLEEAFGITREQLDSLADSIVPVTKKYATTDEYKTITAFHADLIQALGMKLTRENLFLCKNVHSALQLRKLFGCQ